MIGKILGTIALLAPWIAASFLAGMLVVKQEVIFVMKQYHRNYVEESVQRTSTLDLALDNVLQNKFRKNSIIYDAMKTVVEREKNEGKAR